MLCVKPLPASDFVVFHEETRNTMAPYAYSQWLPQSGYLLNEDLLCDLEIFDAPDNYGEIGACNVLLPVCKASEQ